MPSDFNNDHDLLVKLSTQMAMVLDELKMLKDTTIVRVVALEKDKADKIELQVIQRKVNEDVEERIRCLEQGMLEKGYYEGKHDELVKKVNELSLSDAVLNSKASMMSVYISYAMAALSIIIGVIEKFFVH